jgi:hypothetical protein
MNVQITTKDDSIVDIPVDIGTGTSPDPDLAGTNDSYMMSGQMKRFNELFISNLETTSRDNEERLARVIKYPQPTSVAELGASFMETTTQWVRNSLV